jgi:hypothetical protein
MVVTPLDISSRKPAASKVQQGGEFLGLHAAYFLRLSAADTVSATGFAEEVAIKVTVRMAISADGKSI